jgi:hypothetical protein
MRRQHTPGLRRGRAVICVRIDGVGGMPAELLRINLCDDTRWMFLAFKVLALVAQVAHVQTMFRRRKWLQDRVL